MFGSEQHIWPWAQHPIQKVQNYAQKLARLVTAQGSWGGNDRKPPHWIRIVESFNFAARRAFAASRAFLPSACAAVARIFSTVALEALAVVDAAPDPLDRCCHVKCNASTLSRRRLAPWVPLNCSFFFGPALVPHMSSIMNGFISPTWMPAALSKWP